MEIKFESSLTTYMQKVKPLLMKKEACNNLILGLLDRMEGLDNKGENHFGLVLDKGITIFAFIWTPPNNWILADVEGVSTSIIEKVCEFLNEQGKNVPGVIGPRKIAKAFMKKWTERSGQKAVIHMEQLVYRLDTVLIEPKSNGRLQQAEQHDLDLAAEWLEAFGDQANEDISRQQAKDAAKRFIDNGSLYFWNVAGKKVSMVNRSRKSENGATINAVFTPDAFKRKGYATDAVTALSAKLLGDGFSFCSLYTDAANPTSNNIYKKIGYRIVGDSIVYRFFE